MVSIYERQGNVKQLSIDCLPLRKGVCKEFAYHNVNSMSNKRKHIHGVDAYDNAKVLSSMASRRRKHTVNQVSKQWYMIVSSDCQYKCKVKSSHLLSKCQELVNKGITFTVKEV